MKKSILMIVAVLMVGTMMAQMPPMPIDPAIRMGQLDNGLTYYIRYNAEPKNQANFYIAQKVGSIQEEESQRGLAHFLEHMCFNGTEHFPGNGVIQYCQRIGVKFGADLNAYTSIDETVYNIDHVPTTTPGAIDSCLLILHDWADGLLLLDEDIDKERGVIHEEWRTRSNATMRLYEALIPQIYPNNRYGQRFPIGLMSVVDSFPYQVLRDYYEKWYRTDLQGIVVVGDVNVDEIEQKIQSIFGTIAPVENPAERVYIPVENNANPIVAIGTDKEQTYAQTYLFIKYDNVPNEAKNAMDYYVYQYALQVAADMINSRLEEMVEKPNAPFSYAATETGSFFIAQTKQAIMGICVGDESKLTEGVTSLYREILRAIRNGFTGGEYERARTEYLSQVEKAYNAREKKMSEQYCREIVRHFLENEPIMNAEQEYALANQLLPNIPVDVVNQIMKGVISDSTNLVVMCMLPEKAGVTYPTNEAMSQSLREVEAEEIAPYEDKVNNEPLISKLPKPGKIKKREEAKLGYTRLTLKNGVNVYIKHTDLNKDEVLLSAFSQGGASLYDEREALDVNVAIEVAQVGGLGKFSLSDLKKAQAGKQVSLNPNISLYSEELNGTATPKDLENLFQLIYLTFTDIREDEEAFESWKQRTYAMKMNEEKEPTVAFRDSLLMHLYQHNPRIGSLKAEQVEQVNYQRCLAIARERFSNAADFTFVITGNYDGRTIETLIEQYLGALPTTKEREQYENVHMDMVKGNKDVIFDRTMEVPMSWIIYIQNGQIPFNMRYRLATKMIADILGIVYTEEIREKEAGTYYIVSTMDQEAWPTPEGYAQTFYQTNPERYAYLNSKIDSIQNDFAVNGPSEVNLNKVRESILKEHRQALTENSYWSSKMVQWLEYHLDMHDAYVETINSYTTEDLRVIYNELRQQNNQLRVIMNGVK